LSSKINNKIFVLGSGFSKCCGLPLGGRELFRECFNNGRRGNYPEDSDIVLRMLEFFYPNFKENLENFPDIEEFCTLLIDNTIQFPRNKTRIENVLEAIKRQVSLLINTKQTTLKDDYRNIEQFARQLKEGDIVISLNYDTLVEKALFKIHKGENIISYIYNKDKISILKLHGSINWLIKKNKIRKHEKFDSYFYELYDSYISKNFDYVGGDLTETDNNIYIYSSMISPSYYKRPHNEILGRIWEEAYNILRDSGKIIIIGYSMPPADTNIRHLFSAISYSESIIEIINPDITIKYRFENCFGKNLKFIETYFELSDYSK